MTLERTELWTVKVGEEQTSALWEDAAEGARHGTVVLAHGASTHREHPRIASLAAAFRARGLAVVRLNFLYAERGHGPPDRMPRLMECYAAVTEQVRRRTGPGRLIIGGQSMGGRVASMLAAEGHRCDGVLLLAYPLHPAGRPEKRRDEHLGRIDVPVLCINGTRDELCRQDLMQRTVETLPPRFTMHWIEGADHGFRVPRSSGRTEADVLAQIGDVTAGWAAGIAG